MNAFKTLSVLAIAGAALAAPLRERDVVYETDVTVVYKTVEAPEVVNTVVQTAYAYATVYAAPSASESPAAPQSFGGYGGGHHSWGGHHSASSAPVQSAPPAYTPAPAPSSVAPVSSAPVSSAPAYTPAPAPSSVYVAPSSVVSSAPAASATGGGSLYMGIVNEWRQKLGKPTLTYDATLEANSLKTCQDDAGTMSHELNPGSFAQVLAPGKDTVDSFTSCFVGGWLCERPDMTGMDGICATASAGWEYTDGTGHADILTSTSYTKIGCAYATGIWGCDLA